MFAAQRQFSYYSFQNYIVTSVYQNIKDLYTCTSKHLHEQMQNRRTSTIICYHSILHIFSSCLLSESAVGKLFHYCGLHWLFIFLLRAVAKINNGQQIKLCSFKLLGIVIIHLTSSSHISLY